MYQGRGKRRKRGVGDVEGKWREGRKGVWPLVIRRREETKRSGTENAREEMIMRVKEKREEDEDGEGERQ